MFVPTDHKTGSPVIKDLTDGFRFFPEDGKPAEEPQYFVTGAPRAKALTMANAAARNFNRKTKTLKVDSLQLPAREGVPQRQVNPFDWFCGYLLSPSFGQKYGHEKGVKLEADLKHTLDNMEKALTGLQKLLE